MNNQKVKLIKHNLNDFPQQLQDIFHFLSISSNYFLVGSADYKNFILSADFDLNERYKANDTPTVLNHLYENFKEKFELAMKDPDMFIIDFKCGEDEKGEPIRWTYKDMVNPKLKDKFMNCLVMKATMKLDMIVFFNGSAVEITDNYFLTIGKHKHSDEKPKNDTIKSLVEDYNILISEKKYFKALKRLFSIQTIENKPSEKLINLFNSDLGRLYKAISDINTIILLLEQTFKKCPLNKIINNLQIIKYSVSKVVSVNVNFVTTEIDNICKIKNTNKIKSKLESLSEKLRNILNTKVEKYLIKI